MERELNSYGGTAKARNLGESHTVFVPELFYARPCDLPGMDVVLNLTGELIMGPASLCDLPQIVVGLDCSADALAESIEQVVAVLQEGKNILVIEGKKQTEAAMFLAELKQELGSK